MKFTETEVFNFKGAIRGMRNPMNSWDKSDSICTNTNLIQSDEDYGYTVADTWVIHNNEDIELWSDEYESNFKKYYIWLEENGILTFDDDTKSKSNNLTVAYLGPNDLNLMQRLILAGPEHAKFLRQIFVSVDITAPLYWWKEFDTYKVGTVANSTSTMHKLAAASITKEMFEFNDNSDDIIVNQGKSICGEWEYVFSDYIDDIIDMCENLRQKYLETNDKSYWRALIQILPSASLQTRTVTMSYANLRNIYFQRQHHKLKEWSLFCEWILTLPYSKELIIIE